MTDPVQKNPRATLFLYAAIVCVLLCGASHGARIEATQKWVKITLGGVAGAFMGLAIAFVMRYGSLKRTSTKPPSPKHTGMQI